MKLSKKAISLLLVLSIVISLIVPIELTTNADTVPPVGVKFNLRAVNLLSGEEILTATSTLTIQYTDATLGDNINMYVSITKNDGTAVLSDVKVENADLTVINGVTVYGADEEVGRIWRDKCSYSLCSTSNGKELATGNAGSKTIVKNNIHSNAAGSVSFVPGSAVAGLSVFDLQVTVYTKDTSTGVCSSKATTAINNGFTSDTPDGLTSSNWMNYIDGSTLLSQINIPGTHDSGTTYIKGSAANQCQNLTIADQLELGARYLDIRAYNGKCSRR